MMKIRLTPLLGLIVSTCIFLIQAMPASAIEPVRIGLTPTFLNERHALMADWRGYLERKMKQPVIFVLRDNYQETMELLHQRRIDVAWLCDCPHVTANPDFQLLATPLFQGRPYYRSYLIVPESDRTSHSILDLKGRVFAYTDPYANVGHLVPRYEIKKSGADPEHFFRRTFFTRSQRKAIESVAVGVADGAAVNSYIWETMNSQAPALTGKTRVAARSREYGFPPFVADHTFSAKNFRRLQQALLDMASDEQGRAVLKKMNLDGFTLPKPEIYRDVQEIVHFMQGNPPP
jgi:phosphonate transport system substrate-binding protein